MKKTAMLLLALLLALSVWAEKPIHRKLNAPPKGENAVKATRLLVDRLIDAQDATTLGNLFKLDSLVYGISVTLGNPSLVTLYTSTSKSYTAEALKSEVETPSFEMMVHGGNMRTMECDFGFVSLEPNVAMLDRQVFLDLCFPKSVVISKKNQAKYGDKAKGSIYELPYPDLDKPMYQRQLPALCSYLSGEDGILKIETALKGDDAVIRIHYVKTVLNDDKIWTLLTSPTWKVYGKEGQFKTRNAGLHFPESGKTIQ